MPLPATSTGRSTKGTGPAGTEPLLLGLDIGSSRTKATLLDAAGREVGQAAAVTPFVKADGRVEAELQSLVDCVGRVLTGLGDQRRQVVAAGLAGMAESGVPLDEVRHPLAPVIAWHDGRGEEAVALLERRLGTGLARHTGQGANTKMTVAKLGWLLEHQPGVRGMTRWLGVPELLLYALTGAEVTEHSLAARTGCYDIVAHRWMPEVAAAVGFSTDVFPRIDTAGEVMGRVTAEGAAWSGLPEGVPVTVAGHDHLAGMAGAGVRPGELANSVGTAETIVARTATVPDLAAARDRRVAVTVYPGATGWAALVGAARAGLVIESAASALGRSPAELDRLATGAEPVDVGDAVDLLARGAPPALPDASPGRIWAGILDALTARTVDAFRRLTEVVGPAERMVVFGGGSASEPWLRAKAAALPLPVVSSTVTSAVARGAALHAGVTAGWWPSEADAPAPVSR